MTNNKPAIVDYAIEFYIHSGKGLTVKEMAAKTGFSESTVRKAMTVAEDEGVLLADKECRESCDRSYGIQVGYHWVAVYVPTRTTLLNIIRASRTTG